MTVPYELLVLLWCLNEDGLDPVSCTGLLTSLMSAAMVKAEAREDKVTLGGGSSNVGDAKHDDPRPTTVDVVDVIAIPLLVNGVTGLHGSLLLSSSDATGESTVGDGYDDVIMQVFNVPTSLTVLFLDSIATLISLQ